MIPADKIVIVNAKPLTCEWCDEEILPHEFTDQRLNGKPVHRECIFRAVCGSAAHQLHECSCFGGTREDPPGLTKRQAAKLALEAYEAITAEGE